LFLFSSALLADDISLSYSIQPRWFDYNDESYINTTEDLIEKTNLVSTQILELVTGTENIALTATLKNRLQSDKKAESEVTVKELVYANTLGNWDYSVGRRISSWGVGSAFRPLDVVQQQDLQDTDQETITGVNQLALERFSGMSSLGFYLINPSEDNQQSGKKQLAIITRFSESKEKGDWQGLLRLSQLHKLQAGIGGLYVINDALELHGSVLYSARYQRMEHSLSGQNENLLATEYPWETVEYHDAKSWMLGGNLTWSERHNLIFEYWFDPLALDKSQWAEQLNLMQEQNLLLGSPAPQQAVQGNLAWSTEALANPHLVQDNLFLRWSYQGDEYLPQASILYSPADSSFMFSTSLGLDKYSMKFNIGLRLFSGSQDSVYGQMPVTSQLFLTAYGDF
jgi:hypothetical protein